MPPFPERIRSFIALELPQMIAAQLQDLQDKSPIPPLLVRWVPTHQMHLTLKFLGNIPGEAVPSLSAKLGSLCLRHPPLTLRAEGLGCFPNLRQPRVIWAGLQGDLAELEKLQEAIAELTRDLAEKEEHRRFAPHLTLGRVREEAGRRAREVGEAVSQAGQPVFGAWPVTHVRLMRSELSPHGARHTVLGEFRLGG